MKQNETLSFIKAKNLSNLIFDESNYSSKTPLRSDAFDIDDKTKIKLIESHFSEIMKILGLDLSDDSLKDTPSRVAKMYVKEYFSGLNPQNKPKLTLFKNKYNYKQMVIEKDISFYSNCEHSTTVTKPTTGRSMTSAALDEAPRLRSTSGWPRTPPKPC